MGAVLASLVLLMAPAAARADEAEPLYETDSLAIIDLGLSSQAEAELESEPGEYVEGTVKIGLDDDGVPGGSVTELTSERTVGIHLKGSELGSFRPLTGKAAFKLKFNKFGGKFLGLKKMTLNNMVEDRSMIHEALTYTVFRDLGVPAPRTGYAYVRLNDHPYGVYLDIEDVDDVALERIFGSFDEETQHLYEGEYHDDVVPGGAADFAVDEGEEGDLGDLEALIAAANATSPAYAQRMAPVADLKEMTLMWAIEKYLGRWDGYAGRAGVDQPNNYFLYSEPDGRFQMLPWGSDETWEEKLDFEGHDGLMFNLCLEDEKCFHRYWQALHGAREEIATLPLDALAEHLAGLLEPWQEDDPRKEQTQSEIAAKVAQARAFITARPGEADSWLDANEPPAEPEEPGESEEGGSMEEAQGGEEAKEAETPGSGATLRPPQPPSGPPAKRSAKAVPRPRLLGVTEHPGQLRLRVRLFAPGRVRGWVSIQAGAGRRRVCAPAASVAGAETVVLTCRFPGFIRRRLQYGALRARAVIRLTPTAGPTRTTIRGVTLPRR